MKPIPLTETQMAELFRIRVENETLRTRLAELEKQKPAAFAVLEGRNFDDSGWGYIASWPEACQEHINEAISEHSVEGAGKWRVVPLYTAPVVSPDVEKLIADHNSDMAACHEQFMDVSREVMSLKTELEAARKDAEHKQCRIDELILEFCPSEMTADQLNRWRKCQIPAIEQANGGV